MAAQWVELAEQVRTGAVSLGPYGPRTAEQCLANAKECNAEASRIRRLLLAADARQIVDMVEDPRA
jgi:hypothetical protein